MKYLCLLVLLVLMGSCESDSRSVAGTYSHRSDTAQVQLTLHSDHTFTGYFQKDYFKIDTQGNWQMVDEDNTLLILAIEHSAPNEKVKCKLNDGQLRLVDWGITLHRQ